jgi:hypothetical protein
MNLNNIKFRKHEIKRIIENYKTGIIKLEELPKEFLNFLEEIKNFPRKPFEPEESECCGSGCRPCVMDLYEERLQEYEDRIHEIYEKVNCDE